MALRQSNTPLARSTLTVVFLLPIISVLIIPTNLLRSLRLHLSPPPPFDFPPPLSRHFAHLQRPSTTPLPHPPDWRTPAVLTAHAHPHPTHPRAFILTIYTTGTDAGAFHRNLTRVGCAVADVFYPAYRLLPEAVRCRIPNLPPPGARLTVLLAWDPALRAAIRTPHRIHGVLFRIPPTHVTPANATLASTPVARVRSRLRWYPALFDPPRTHRPRYELCVMTQIKHDAHLLPAWIAFYRRLGVDRFYIYDNRAPTALQHIHPFHVEVVYWPWTRAQTQAYNHFLFSSRTRCKYSAFFDVDEYAFIGARQPRLLPAYVAHRVRQGYHQAVLPQFQMHSNGYVKRPSGPVPERYTRAEKYQRGFGVKPILETDFEWLFHNINLAHGGNTYFNVSVIPHPNTLDDNAIIVHYTSRSWEEFVDKRREGSTAINLRYYPPSKLNVTNPQNWYLTQAHSSEMLQFRTFWRTVMSMKDSGNVRMTWDHRNQSCIQDYCPSCIFRNMGTVTCTDR